MASSAAHTIVLRSNNPDNAMQRVREAPAYAALTPGMLLMWGATAGSVAAHGTANGHAQGRKVALENPWSNHGSGPAIAHAYATGERVGYLFAQPGDQLYMLLAAGQDVGKGQPLVSNGDGTLRAGTINSSLVTEAVVGYAAEAVDNDPGSGGAAVRIRVDIA